MVRAKIAPKTPAVAAITPRSLGYRMPAEWEPHAVHMVGLAAQPQ